MIRIRCVCTRQLLAPDEMAGQAVRCPACRAVQWVPDDAEIEPSDDAEDDWDDGSPGPISHKVIVSLSLGILSFFCSLFTGVPAIILGAMALGDIRRESGRRGGRGLAIAGIVTGALGVLVVAPALLIATLLPVVHRFRETAVRTQSASNLRQMAVGLNEYCLSNNERCYPPTGGGRGRHPGLSWRVAILPFVDEEDVFEQFHLDEPWDSPHNKSLLPLMPQIYAMPWESDAAGMTRYRALAGADAAFTKPDPGGKPPRGRYIGDFAGGVGLTIFVAEAADPVPWTKPEELDYDPRGPLPHLGYRFGRCQVAMGDANVATIYEEMREFDVRKMIQRMRK